MYSTQDELIQPKDNFLTAIFTILIIYFISALLLFAHICQDIMPTTKMICKNIAINNFSIESNNILIDLETGISYELDKCKKGNY